MTESWKKEECNSCRLFDCCYYLDPVRDKAENGYEESCSSYEPIKTKVYLVTANYSLSAAKVFFRFRDAKEYRDGIIENHPGIETEILVFDVGHRTYLT